MLIVEFLNLQKRLIRLKANLWQSFLIKKFFPCLTMTLKKNDASPSDCVKSDEFAMTSSY